mmetsp:Transcript_40406/g.121747  ORF Transcript_40406/g.121747 Transcript_40406/m.121747 type:complete len:242 (-) Transcript_40406:51-776(-)
MWQGGGRQRQGIEGGEGARHLFTQEQYARNTRTRAPPNKHPREYRFQLQCAHGDGSVRVRPHVQCTSNRRQFQSIERVHPLGTVRHRIAAGFDGVQQQFGGESPRSAGGGVAQHVETRAGDEPLLGANTVRVGSPPHFVGDVGLVPQQFLGFDSLGTGKCEESQGAVLGSERLGRHHAPGGVRPSKCQIDRPHGGLRRSRVRLGMLHELRLRAYANTLFVESNQESSMCSKLGVPDFFFFF